MFKQYIKSELAGWKRGEVIWLGAASLIILLLSLYWKDNALGLFSALTGVWCVILTGCFVCTGRRSQHGHKNNREKYSGQIKSLLHEHGKEYRCIAGSYQPRYEQAVEAVERLLSKERKSGIAS